MAENRYDIAICHPPMRKLERPDIQIRKYNLGQEVSHWNLEKKLSRFWLIYWNSTSGATLEFRNVTLEMTPDKLVLIPPYTLVTAHTRHPFIHNFVEFTAGSPFDSVKVEPLFFRTEDYAPELKADCDPVRKSLSLYILVERLLLAVPGDSFTDQNPVLFESRVQAAIQYMDTHFMKKFSITELCHYVNLSESRFLHLFKEKTGISPRDYWLKLRINLVVRMLEDTDLSIPEIAEEAGFTDRSHLTRVFKACFGLTPAMIRKKNSSSL